MASIYIYIYIISNVFLYTGVSVFWQKGKRAAVVFEQLKTWLVITLTLQKRLEAALYFVSTCV